MLIEDKLLHFGVGCLIVLLGLVFKIKKSHILILLVGAALGKELFDRYYQFERFDIFDLLVTTLPGIKLIIDGKTKSCRF